MTLEPVDRSSLAAQPVNFPLDTRGRWAAASGLSSRPLPLPRPLTADRIQTPKAWSRKQIPIRPYVWPSQVQHLIHWCENIFVC